MVPLEAAPTPRSTDKSWFIHGVELSPTTGDYLITAVGAPAVARVSKTGVVRIPLTMPKNTGITVFVAGVIYSAGRGAHTVTNTHWFVLS